MIFIQSLFLSPSGSLLSHTSKLPANVHKKLKAAKLYLTRNMLDIPSVHLSPPLFYPETPCQELKFPEIIPYLSLPSPGIRTQFAILLWAVEFLNFPVVHKSTKVTSQLMKMYFLKWDLVLGNKIKVIKYIPKAGASGQRGSAWKKHHRRTQCFCGRSTSSKGWVQFWDPLPHPAE